MEYTIETLVDAPVDLVWNSWTEPQHITKWNFASPEWHCPRAEIDLRVQGTFNYRMEAIDGSMGFDFTGAFTKIDRHQLIEYVLDDNRKVRINFSERIDGTSISEIFAAEDEISGEQQKQGWQAILNNFKAYAESIKS